MVDDKQIFDIKLKEIVPEYYSKKKYRREVILKRLKIAISYLHDIKAKRILDAGCGDGLFDNMLKNEEGFSEVVAVDYNIYVEELNKKYKNIKFIRADIDNLKFKKKFDVITCLDVLEHFKGLEKTLLHLKKFIIKDGYLIISGPTESFWYKLGRLITKGVMSKELGPPPGRHYYNVNEVDKIIKKHFKLIKKKSVYFLFFRLFDIILYQNTD